MSNRQQIISNFNRSQVQLLTSILPSNNLGMVPSTHVSFILLSMLSSNWKQNTTFHWHVKLMASIIEIRKTFPSSTNIQYYWWNNNEVIVHGTWIKSTIQCQERGIIRLPTVKEMWPGTWRWRSQSLICSRFHDNGKWHLSSHHVLIVVLKKLDFDPKGKVQVIHFRCEERPQNFTQLAFPKTYPFWK